MTIDKEIVIKAEPQTVFNVLTDADQIPEFYPYEKVLIDPRVGGEFVCTGSDGQSQFKDIGYVVSIDSPYKFSYRYWSDNHGTEQTDANYLSISYELRPSNAGTLLHLTHDNIGSLEYYSTMDTAWDFLLASLKKYVENQTNRDVT